MKKDKINRYYNINSAIEVLSSLLNNPSLLNKNEYVLREEDFVTPTHKVIFKCAYNLGVVQGFREIKIGDIESYLSQREPVSHKKIFENEENLKWLTSLKENESSDFDYYYNKLKKFSLIRAYLKNGIECVTKLFDPDETEIKLREQQENRLDNMRIEDIKKYVNDSLMDVNTIFTSYDEALTHRKSGDNAEELWDKLLETPPYGFNTESQYLNTAIMGWLPERLIIETRGSNMGKSRNAIKRLVDVCSPYIWDDKTKQYIENPNQKGNSGLYIGTEMNIYKDLEPMIWAFISGVEQSHIKNRQFEEGEEERVLQAIQYSKEMNLFLEDKPDYDASWMWRTVEYYKEEYNICMVCLDYLEITPSINAEYVKNGGTRGKDDIALITFSNELKQMANKFKLTMIFYTQAIRLSDIERMDFFDNNTIKGCANLHVKADIGITVFPPTAKMLDTMSEVIQVCNRRLRKEEGCKFNLKPNAIYTLYKNRETEIREIKIWGYLNQGTGRFIEMFVTDRENNLISLDKTSIKVNVV